MYDNNYDDSTESSEKGKRSDKLTHKELKDNVNDWFRYFKENNDRFNYFMKFVFKTTITQEMATNLKSLGKPIIEFNGLPAMVSRERSQFVMNTPGFEVSLRDGMMYDQIPKEVLSMKDAIEGNIRYAFCNKNNDLLQYNTYTEQLVGGYSAWEMKEQYTGKYSLEKELITVKTIHPTMTGWDPSARLSHKGDGDRAFELVPLKKREFERLHGKYEKNKGFSPRNSGLGDVTWSYRNSNEEFVVVCYYYQKLTKDVKYIQFSNGQLIPKNEVAEYLEDFDEEDAPIETGNSKIVEEDCIYRYVFSECGIHEYEETTLPMLPYIFVDGSSGFIGDNGGEHYQVTKSYVKDAEGLQIAKNISGQTLVYDMECLVQSPFMTPWEAIKDLPDNYKGAWLNPQKKSMLVYNSFLKGPDAQQVPMPTQIQKQETPRYVLEMFFNADTMIGVAMGSHQAQLTEQGPHMSGVAQDKAMMMSSMTAQPYVTSHTAAMERAAQYRLHWMEKNMINPRIIPVITKEGKHDMQPINSEKDSQGNPIPDNINLDFKADHFEVSVKPGNNVEAQKELALQSMRDNAQAFPAFAGLVNEEGLEVILNNIEMRDIDVLRAKAPEYQDRVKAAKAQAAQNGPMDPVKAQLQIAQMQTSQKEQADQRKYQADMAKVSVSKQEADIEAITAMADISSTETQNAIKQEQVDAENARTVIMEAADLHIKNHEIRKDHHVMRLEESQHEMDRQRHEKELKMMDKPQTVDTAKKEK